MSCGIDAHGFELPRHGVESKSRPGSKGSFVSWQVVRLEDVSAAPWRNGGGSTRQLVAWPNDLDWTWRMSVAEVDQDGPFSVFDGVERWFAVLDGAGVELDISAAGRRFTHRLTSSDQPFLFDGGWTTRCKLLQGKTQDFNLMVRERGGRESGSPRSRMARVGAGFDMVVGASTSVAVYALPGGSSGRLDEDAFSLPAGSLAWRPAATDARLVIDSGRALVMEMAA